MHSSRSFLEIEYFERRLSKILWKFVFHGNCYEKQKKFAVFSKNYIFLYKLYLTFKIKRDNHQVPKIVRVPRNKAKPKKIS